MYLSAGIFAYKRNLVRLAHKSYIHTSAVRVRLFQEDRERLVTHKSYISTYIHTSAVRVRLFQEDRERLVTHKS